MRDKPRPKPINNDIILPILEDKPQPKWRRVMGYFFILGVAGVAVSLFFPNGDVKWTILGISGPLVVIPLFTYMVSNPDDKAGIIRFTDHEILVKRTGQQHLVFPVKEITRLNYVIKDYEAEDRTEDLLTLQGRMTVRTGEENFVAWETKTGNFGFQFKLVNEFQFKMAEKYLGSLKKAVNESNKYA
ncbi:MAG TPA: hypothetical protein VK177_05480 [Flavobacteriales bacterium]|nr:hypothetical protein [Flavobacteriales bacterium]